MYSRHYGSCSDNPPKHLGVPILHLAKYEDHRRLAADLDRRLMDQASLIADRTVQNEYRRFFRDRLFVLGRPDRKVRPGGTPRLIDASSSERGML